jgi:hypothetical protein
MAAAELSAWIQVRGVMRDLDQPSMTIWNGFRRGPKPEMRGLLDV